MNIEYAVKDHYENSRDGDTRSMDIFITTRCNGHVRVEFPVSRQETFKLTMDPSEAEDLAKRILRALGKSV